MSIHKAKPVVNEDKGFSICLHCGENVKRVPSGQGTTWIHMDGFVVAKGEAGR